MPKVAAVRDGDFTTTGGRVFASGSNISDKGVKVALDGNEASCGTCEGLFKILGTGRSVLAGGRCVATDNDRVLCPCNKNRLIVGSNPGVWLKVVRTDTPVSMLAVEQQHVASATAVETFDEQIRIVVRDNATDGYPYRIEMPDGRTFAGRVESGGALPRMMTGESADDYTVYWGEDAFDKSGENSIDAE